MRNILSLIFAATLWLSLSPAASAATISVTLPPLSGLVMMLDDQVRVQCLMPAGSDPHHFQMQPRTIERLQQSTLLIRAYRDDGGWPLPAVHANTLDLWPLTDHGWVSPKAVRDALPKIAQALINLQPERQQHIEARLQLALQQVDLIAAAWQPALKQASAGIIMQHPSWRRLIKEMGIPVLAVLESGHHGHEFGPHHLEHALTTLNQHAGAWLLADAGHSASALDWLAAHSNQPVKRITLNALGQCKQPWDLLMQENIRQLTGQQ
ncbi:MAG: zinc ABC transporter substrate-binding protein [Mariprofundus sp.]